MFYEWRDKLLSKREQWDEALLIEIRRVHQADFGVCGGREGVRRGTVKRTMIPDPATRRPDPGQPPVCAGGAEPVVGR